MTCRPGVPSWRECEHVRWRRMRIWRRCRTWRTHQHFFCSGPGGSTGSVPPGTARCVTEGVIFAGLGSRIVRVPGVNGETLARLW